MLAAVGPECPAEPVPKCTGHMVYGRARRTAGRRTCPVPPGQWLWSPEPTHPAL